MRLLVIAVLMLFSSAASCTDKDDGNKLIYELNLYLAERSKTDLEFLTGMEGTSYVDGVTDILLTEEKICIPENAKAGQTYRIVANFLEKHPDKLHLNASILVYAALYEAWPCSK